MDKIKFKGPAKLKGSIKIPGSKNASLPLLVSSILSDKKLILNNLPELQDILTMEKLLENFVIKVIKTNSQTFLESYNINNSLAD